MRGTREGPEWAWIDRIEIGDILLTPSGDLRMVREVSKFRKQRRLGQVACVTLAIRNCSWTGSGYTVINRVDIRQRKFQPTGLKAVCSVDISKTTCCEAKGLL